MGVVYEAIDEALDRTVALKLIAPELAAEPGFRGRFMTESRIAASLDHPNVVPIYRAGEEDGVLFLAMRFVAGDDLRTLVERDGPLEPGRAAGMVAQVAAALAAAHARGLVHRDVKPANVLVTAEDHCYLTDFGLVKDLAATTGATRTGEVLGTLDYVAPERIRGGETGPWTDVYALGCVLFFALTGRVVFPLEEPERKLWAHLSEPPPSASVTPAVDAVVARALAKAPRERYESAPALAAALREAVGDATVAVAVGDIGEIERRLIEVRRQQIPGKVQLVEQLAQQLADLRRTGGA
jgi:serine/threonine-protein kinase